ncbi:hypothetical protein EYM_03790 [Ignicoccus islandicus DSM 13165]|uniref:Uncharacterized protein n=1 Tax=Ignicoccus islandicus DSM 13165 TaxID=940295 RepID=A0A0U3DY66_9CREN|nr:DHHA1 domain-containing protein [Ignicoccus islandicus]ALU12442.1 hypothetical protein EYM_03790 [Ignicoccus islandicus DSM 13165]
MILKHRKRPVKREKVVVVHHNDFDGIMGAVALYRYHSSSEFKAIGSSRRNFLKNFKKAVKEKPNVLYVVDIGPNESEIPMLRDLLTGKNFKLIWMDHHKWTDEVLKSVNELADEVVYDRSTCGAGLAARYVESKGYSLCNCCKELVDLSCDIDLWIRSDPRSEKMSLALGNLRWRGFLVDKLWKCIGWDRDWEDAYREVLEYMNKVLDRGLNKKVELQVNGIKAIVIPITRKEIALVSFLAEELRKRAHYDVIVFVSDVGSVHMRRGSETIDLSELARKLGGGGHPAAAGASLNYTFIDKLIHKLFLKPRRIEEIEKALKEVLKESNVTERTV